MEPIVAILSNFVLQVKKTLCFETVLQTRGEEEEEEEEEEDGGGGGVARRTESIKTVLFIFWLQMVRLVKMR